LNYGARDADLNQIETTLAIFNMQKAYFREIKVTFNITCRGRDVGMRRPPNDAKIGVTASPAIPFSGDPCYDPVLLSF
jgi:hypothetical protein